MPVSPDLQGDSYEDGAIGLIEIGDGTYLLPSGSAGDVLVLWLLCERGWVSGTFPTIFSIEQVDASATVIGTLTVAHEVDLEDSRLFVATGTRASGLDEVQVTFGDVAGPTGWVIGSFPAGTYQSLPGEVLSGQVDSFSPSGSGVFAGVIVSFWEADPSPTITSPTVDASRRSENTVYAFRAFGHDGSGPFTAEMAAPSNAVIYGHALLRGVGRWRVGRIGWPS